MGEKLGTSFGGGMVHLLDMHATMVDVVASSSGKPVQSMGHPVDGISFWSALSKGTSSPRTEFVINIDPCSGHGTCNGVEAGIRSGDWKFLSNVQSDTWYPVPTSAESNSRQRNTA